jgi:hypothetical protein
MPDFKFKTTPVSRNPVHEHTVSEPASVVTSAAEETRSSSPEPTVATWRGENDSALGLIEGSWKLFLSTPLTFRLYVLFAAALNLSLPFLLDAPKFILPLLLRLAVDLTSLSWLLLVPWVVRLKNHATLVRCQELVDPESPFQQQVVRIVVRRGQDVIGEDEGTAVISDGMLVFQGLRTHFALTSDYLQPLNIAPKSVLNRLLFAEPSFGGPAKVLFFYYRVDGIDYKVRLYGVPSKSSNSSGLESPSKQRELWAKSAPWEGGYCVLPPTSPAPYPSRRSQNLRLLGVGSSVFLVVHYASVILRLAMEHLYNEDYWTLVFAVLIAVPALLTFCFTKARRMDKKLDAMAKEQRHSDPGA